MNLHHDPLTGIIHVSIQALKLFSRVKQHHRLGMEKMTGPQKGHTTISGSV